MNSLGDNVGQVYCREALLYNLHNIYIPKTIPCKMYVAALA